MEFYRVSKNIVRISVSELKIMDLVYFLFLFYFIFFYCRSKMKKVKCDTITGHMLWSHAHVTQ